MNYFRPESSSSSSSSSISSSSSSISSSSSSSTPVSSVSVSAKLTARSPAWQGKIDGSGRTRCHDGKILPFRARCNKVEECDGQQRKSSGGVFCPLVPCLCDLPTRAGEG